MHPKMTPVHSTNIEGMAYVGDTLLVAFRSGKVYAYEHVPADIYHGMEAAPSKGQYLNAVVKRGGFAFRLLDGEGVDALLADDAPAPVPPAARKRKAAKPRLGIAELLDRYPFLRTAF